MAFAAEVSMDDFVDEVVLFHCGTAKEAMNFSAPMDSEHVGRIRPWSRIPKNPDSLVACAQW